MKEELNGLRDRWHGLVRRRLVKLRGRLDRRIERLDEKQQMLATQSLKAQPPVEEEAAVSEAKRPPRRRSPRRRAPHEA